MRRWALNPFQLYDISWLMAASIAQLYLGATPGSVLADNLDRTTVLYLAIANIIGGGIALFGLHLKDLEEALWVEVCGYSVLIFVLGIYVYLMTSNLINPNASYGFALSEAFVYAGIHRSVQILLYKRARRRHRLLAQEALLLERAVVVPTSPVQGEE